MKFKQNKDELPLNNKFGDNSSPVNSDESNGSPHVASKMDINDKKTYLPLIAVSLAVIALWVLFHIELIKLIAQLSLFGIFIIACLAWREYKTQTKNQVNEKQLDKVIELVEYLRTKRKFYLNTQNDREDYVDLMGLLETTNDIHAIKIRSKDWEKLEKNLNYYRKHPLIPFEIAEAIKQFLNQINHPQIESKYIPVEQLIATPAFGNHSKQPEETIEQYFILKESVSELVLELHQWLNQTDVKRINLPPLDPALCPKEKLKKLESSQSKVSSS